MDSGANCSLLSENWYNRNLGNKGVKLYKHSEFLHDLNGNEINIIGHVVVNVSINDIKQDRCVFYVKRDEKGLQGLGKDTEQECLVGMNILATLFEKWGILKETDRNIGEESRVRDQDLCLDSCMRRVGQTLRIWQERHLGRARCIAKQHRSIPAGSRKVIKVFIEKLQEVPREYVVLEGIIDESKNDLPPGIQVLPSFSVCEWGVGYVCIANWNSTAETIESGSSVANVQLGLAEEREGIEEEDSWNATEEDLRKFRIDLGVNINDSELCDEDLRALEFLLFKYKKCFEMDETDLGLIKGWGHQIKLTSEIPIKLPYRRIAPALIPEAKKLLEDLKQRGVIEESKSPYAAPIVLVRKKSGGLRLCIDYRKINKITVKDAFPLPRIAESLDALEGANYFSTFDLAQGYHQILLKEEDREKTAFSVPWGHFQYRRCPMGLTNSPATFQRCMESILGDMVFEFLVVFLDDLILFSKTVQDHLSKMEKLFRRIKAYGIKLKPSKCHFLKTQVNYLGFEISDKGIGPETGKIEAVKEWKRPSTIKELRGFLGFVTFYRRFIRNFAKIAKPLNEFLKGEKKKSNEKIEDKWTENAESAFQTLKEALIKAPIMKGVEFGKDFVLEIDASYDGLGAVLSQYKGSQLYPVAYASRSLKPHERNMKNYSSRKLELCGLRWAVAEKFKNYLIGAKCTVFTDNAPLSNLSSGKLDHIEHKWVSDLAMFDLIMKFKPGKQNMKADALSRQNRDSGVSEDEDVWLTPHEKDMCVRFIERQELLEWEDVESKQKGCPVLKVVRKWFEGEDMNVEDPLYKMELLVWKKEKTNLSINDKLLYKVEMDELQNMRYRLAIPLGLRTKCVQESHDKLGHQGIERTYKILRARVYWPNMKGFVTDYVNNCDICLRTKEETPYGNTITVHIKTDRPMEIVALDFCSVEKSSSGKENILVVSDLFSKYVWAFPTKDQRATTVAKILIEEIFYKFGIPEKIHTDQGRNFESRLIKEVCKRFNVTKSRTTPYHPEGNGQIERMNRTIYGLLRTLDEEKRNKWHIYLQSLVFVYNSTPHSITEFSPYFLFFGREPYLTVDNWRDTETIKDKSRDGEWIDKQWKIQKEAWEIARRNTEKNWLSKAKSKLDRSKSSDLEVGQKVLMRENKVIGRTKLGEKYRKERWVIEEVLNKECGLYKIRPDGYEARVIHRKNIRPVNEGKDILEENINEENDRSNRKSNDSDTEGSETEMPDMAEVLTRFGIDISRIEGNKDNESQSKKQDIKKADIPGVRRSERLRLRREEGRCDAN